MGAFLSQVAAQSFHIIHEATRAAAVLFQTVLNWLHRRIILLRITARTPAPSNISSSTPSPTLHSSSSFNDAHEWFHRTPPSAPPISTYSSPFATALEIRVAERTHESVLTHPFSLSESRPALVIEPSYEANTEQIMGAWHAEWPATDNEDATAPKWLLARSITLPLDLQETAMRRIQPRWEDFAHTAEETPTGVYYERRETLETPVEDSDEDPSPGGSLERSLESERASRRRMDVWTMPVNARFRSTMAADSIALE